MRADRGEVLEHDRREPASLLVVLHRERDLGLVRAGGPVVARHRDDLVTELGDERHPVVVVHVGEVLELLVRRCRHRGEEPHVDRLAREPREQSEQPGVVGGADGPEMDRSAVGEDDVGLPNGRVVLLHRGRG